MSEAFSAIMIVGALVLPDIRSGMMEASTTRRPSIPRTFSRWSVEPTRRIIEGVRRQAPDAKIIGFPRGAGALLPGYVEATGVDAVSIDWAAEPSLIRERVQNRVAIQGNLDPLVLIAGGAALDRAIDDVLANFTGGRLIFNLGHGIQPETPIAHVEQMIKRVRAYRG